MRAVWVDHGTDTDYRRLTAHGITAPFFSHIDPRVTATYFDGVSAHGFTPGVYSAWNWFPTLNGADYAARLSDELRRIGWVGNPTVCVDIETHDPDYISAFLIRWRELRPTRPTWFTFEGFQGGLLAPILATILHANVRLAPQMYRGDMTPHDHSPVLDLLGWGFPGDRIDGMYDAARLPSSWRGFAFTQQRLP